MNSLEKLELALANTRNLVAETEEAARQLQMLQMVAPMVRPMIPDTPEAFDEQLLGMTRFLLGLRSDDADPRPVFALLPLRSIIDQLEEDQRGTVGDHDSDYFGGLSHAIKTLEGYLPEEPAEDAEVAS